ncbi:MAG: hypothetical protein UH239_03875 [Acutalibacteraceae bacterium]|nr:hypothetical protein [Acutalibacteraceae bacterium]
MINLKKYINKLSYVLLVITTVFTAVLFSGCGGLKIDVKEAYLLEVEMNGCNGYGQVELSLNTKNVQAELLKYQSNNYYGEISELLYDIEFTLATPEQNGKLKNDDKFDVVVNYDKELAAEIGLELTNTTITCTAKNLPDGVELDAFKGLKVKFEGSSGNGYASIDYDDCSKEVKNYIYFDIKGGSSNLSNGDEITVTANSYIDLEDEGYFLKEESKKYTVEGLDGARETLEGVDTADLLSEMKKKVNEQIKEDYYVCGYDYKFESGKERYISSYYFSYTTKLDLVNYQYVYDPEDLETNGLIAYYKLATEFKCKDDQSYVSDGETPMKKGDKDTGVTYIAVVTNPLLISSDDKIAEDSYIYYDIENGESIEDLQDELNIGMYSSEYYNKDFKVIQSDDSKSEKTTESSKEKTTATEPTSKVSESSVEKATTKKAS